MHRRVVAELLSPLSSVLLESLPRRKKEKLGLIFKVD